MQASLYNAQTYLISFTIQRAELRVISSLSSRCCLQPPCPPRRAKKKKNRSQCKHLEINLVIIFGGFSIRPSSRRPKRIAHLHPCANATNMLRANRVCTALLDAEVREGRSPKVHMTDGIIDKPEAGIQKKNETSRRWSSRIFVVELRGPDAPFGILSVLCLSYRHKTRIGAACLICIEWEWGEMFGENL